MKQFDLEKEINEKIAYYLECLKEYMKNKNLSNFKSVYYARIEIIDSLRLFRNTLEESYYNQSLNKIGFDNEKDLKMKRMRLTKKSVFLEKDYYFDFFNDFSLIMQKNVFEQYYREGEIKKALSFSIDQFIDYDDTTKKAGIEERMKDHDFVKKIFEKLFSSLSEENKLKIINQKDISNGFYDVFPIKGIYKILDELDLKDNDERNKEFFINLESVLYDEWVESWTAVKDNLDVLVKVEDKFIYEEQKDIKILGAQQLNDLYESFIYFLKEKYNFENNYGQEKIEEYIKKYSKEKSISIYEAAEKVNEMVNMPSNFSEFISSNALFINNISNEHLENKETKENENFSNKIKKFMN